MATVLNGISVSVQYEHLHIILYYYKPFLPPANEVWGKVIFSEACVKNSVHGGEGVVSQHALQVVSQYALQVSSGGLQAYTLGGSWGVWPGGVSRPTPVDGYCRGWYASYWNAFLLSVSVSVSVNAL